MSRRILITTSTFPAHENDPVPSFIKDFVVNLKRQHPDFELVVLAPHDTRSNTKSYTRHEAYDEYRYHYMWPSGLERLSGQGGIIPSLKEHKWLYMVIPFFLLAQIVATIRLTRKVRPDIVHAHWLIPQGFVAAISGLVAKKPLIISIHGSDVSAFKSAPALVLKRFAITRARVVVANSSDSRARLESIVPGRPYPTIPMGVATGDFPSHQAAHTPLRILFIGRLSEEKGVDDLIAALALLKKLGVPFTAKIAGSGPLEAGLKKQAETSGLSTDIAFMGWVARRDIDALYDWADIFVGPSRRDALGVVFIEAGAHGLPVVSTDVGGIPDVILNGQTGITVPVNTPDTIARAIGELAANPALYRAMGQAARSHIAAAFSWESVVTRYKQLYDELLAM